MSGGAAQGASGGAEAAGQGQGGEPTVLDDGFTPEERAQFAEMERDPAPGTGADAGDSTQQGQGDGAGGAGQQQAGADGAGAGKQIAGDDDDEDEEHGGEGQQAQTGQQGQTGQERQPRRVNFNKYARMEQRATEAEKRATELQEMFTRTDERLKLLNEALNGAGKRQQEKNEQQDPEPDPEKDIFGWVQWSRRQMTSMQQMLQQQGQREQASNEEVQVAETYKADARRFASDPNNENGKHFGQAYNFLMNQRVAELALYHYGVEAMKDDGSIDKTKLTADQMRRVLADVAAEERELVTNNIKANKSPAAAIYQMARTRGFRPPAPQQAGAGAGAGAQNGAGTGKAPGGLDGSQGRRVPNVADEIAGVRNRQAAAMSLSQGAGSPGQQALTPERLANMSQAEFDDLMEQIGDSGFQRLMEGGTP